jgi:hypothetical protein
MVSKVFLELVVAAYHCSCFSNISIPLVSGGSFAGSICPLADKKCSYVDLAHFDLLRLSFVVYAGRLLRALDWGGLN